MNSFHSDDDSDFGDLEGTSCMQTVQPYMYEPVRKTNDDQTTSTQFDSEASSSDKTSDNDEMPMNSEDSRLHSLNWCQCGHCSLMPTSIECKCCLETNIVDGKIYEADLSCITEHDGFSANCLNMYVLETTYYEFLQDRGPLEQNELIHEVYRYLAYRRFSRWIWRVLGKNRRKVLPACVVNKIREHFPAEQYTGFKYPK